jgi:hypothetical protein
MWSRTPPVFQIFYANTPPRDPTLQIVTCNIGSALCNELASKKNKTDNPSCTHFCSSLQSRSHLGPRTETEPTTQVCSQFVVQIAKRVIEFLKVNSTELGSPRQLNLWIWPEGLLGHTIARDLVLASSTHVSKWS